MTEDNDGYVSVPTTSAKRSMQANANYWKRVVQVLFFMFLFLNLTNLLGMIPFGESESENLGEIKDDFPLVIAHRGSSGMRPEHTVAAYELAVDQGADIIECDVAVTKDLKLVCSHDPGINRTTDIHAKHAEFHERARTYTIDGVNITDYFIIDFTLTELLTLRKVEYRPYRNQEYNGLFKFATFDEYVATAKTRAHQPVGIYPETKNPAFYNGRLKANDAITTMEQLLVDSLQRHGYLEARAPCFVQSFSVESLRALRKLTALRLVWLRDTSMSEADMMLASELVYALGVDKNLIIQVDPVSRKITGLTSFVERIHKLGMKVHVFTFRNEDIFLAWEYGSDPYAEYEQFYRARIDGFFTDFSASLRNYLASVKQNYSFVQHLSSYLYAK